MSKGHKEFIFSKRAASYDDGLECRMSGRFYNLFQNEVKLGDGMRLFDVGYGTGTQIRRLCAGNRTGCEFLRF